MEASQETVTRAPIPSAAAATAGETPVHTVFGSYFDACNTAPDASG